MSTSAGWERPRTSLYTDHYELTMLQAALHSGAAHRKSVFEAFARRLPDDPSFPVEMVGLYWHFVDIVWIVIFTVVYLIPTPSPGGPGGP